MSLVGASSTSLNVTESDGSPNVFGVSTIKFPNGSVTDNGDGSVTVSVGGSTAPGGSDRHVQFNDGGSFGGNSGFSYDSTGVVSIDAGGGTDTILKLLGSTNYHIKSTTGDELVFHDATAIDDRMKLSNTGDLHLLNDDAQVYFGAGSDAAIWYDGTDLNIDAAVVGSGNLVSATAIEIPADPYDATWGTLLEAATKKDIYDKIEALVDWTADQGATNIHPNNITGLTLGTEVTGASTALTDTADITYNTDTDVSGNSWVLDEDDMSTNSATKVATQQSIKAYVDSVATGLDVKDSVRVATTSAGTLATSF